MSHEISMVGGFANIAYLGPSEDVWHRLGSTVEPGQPIEVWKKKAGMDWTAIMVDAYADLSGPQFDHLPASARRAARGSFVVRSDNGHLLGYGSNRYQPVQPIELLEWADEYVSADPRFELDVAGCLRNGEMIWICARYQEDLKIVGDRHYARMLMTTTFDGSGSTINKACLTRAVCKNTIDGAMMEKGGVVRTRHNTKFNPERAGRELARIIEQFGEFAQLAEALAKVHVSKETIAKYFKTLLDVPHDAKREDISTRKLNQLDALNTAYKITVQDEGVTRETAWAALNAVTRFVDNDRSTRGGANADEARVLSTQFGSGAQLKANAIRLLQAA